MGTFTGHELPILANWSQFLGGVTLIGGVISLYVRHTCAVRWCIRPVFRADSNGVPLCRKHHSAGDYEP